MEIKIPFLTDRITLKDVAVSSRQLATMIDAGLPLMRALSVLAAADGVVRARQDVGSRARRGSGWRLVLGRAREASEGFHARSTSPSSAPVRPAVRSTRSLLRLSDTLEKQVALRNKVRSAMTYPIMVALMVFVILTAILMFIVPTFKQLYVDLGGKLPLPTKVLIFLSDIDSAVLPVLLPLMVVADGFVLQALHQHREGPPTVGHVQAQGADLR